MRPIIFRGKCLDNGEWVEGDYFRKYIYDRYDNGSLHHLIGWQVTDNDGEKFNDYEDVDPDTVGQYTGMKDKNGKKIFEGDIFKEDYSGIVRSVFRVPGGLAFEDNPVSFGYDHRAPVYPYSSIAEMQNASWLSKYCEVVGNIHDNPELLK